MKKFLKIAGVTVVIAFGLQVLINTGIISVNKENLDFEAIQKVIGTDAGADVIEAFEDSPDLPGMEYDDINLKKGDDYLEKGMKSLAVNEYVESIKNNSDNPEAFTKIGKIHFEDLEPAKARENFIKAIQLDPNYIEARIYLGKSYIAENNFDKARQIFGNITTQNQLAKYYKGLLASFYGEHENAKNLFAEAISIGTSDKISEKAQVILKAYQEFARNQGGQDMHLKALLSRAYNQVEEYNMALPILFEILKEQKDYRDAWVILGYSYLNLEKIDDAIYAFETAKKLDPQKPETLYFLGLTHFAKGDLEQAISSIEQALDNGFEPAVQANQKLAEIYLLNEDYENAALNYERILEANNSDINSYVRPVWLYIDKIKNPQKAVEIATRAAENHPDKAMGYNLLGWAQTANGDFSEAKQNLQRAIDIDPELDAAYLNLGWLYEKKNLPSLAKTNYQKAKDLGGSSAAANLAMERYNKIIESEEKVEEIPEDSKIGKTFNLQK
ncbi:MAG: tetratricopeptide repeat protein [Patescibacteria group bacterium]|nr:tetratricopeptide repeat protein [Patescibacteria group bacterium]